LVNLFELYDDVRSYEHQMLLFESPFSPTLKVWVVKPVK